MFKQGNASGILTDTERMKALTQSQAVIEFSPDGTVQHANQNFLDTIGYDLDEIVGKHHRMFVTTEEAGSAAYTRFWDDLRAGKFRSAEFRRVGKGGREVWIQASYNPIKNKAGDVIGIMKLASDTTDAKKASLLNAGQIAALNQSQAVIHFAPDGTILQANDNFLAAVGYSMDEIRGRHHSMFVADEDQGPRYEAFWGDLRHGEYQAAEYRRIAKGGREFFINATYNPIFDTDGNVIRIVKFATDETDRVERMRAVQSIDTGLALIEDAISNVAKQAAEAYQSSTETSENVRSVATGSSQLASSFTEVSSRLADAGNISAEAVDKAQEASNQIGSLTQSAEQISSVVKMISDIAAQTNLLALNATIEAARAGEAGKGFAVVASEVKALASQSANATEDITRQILAVQTSTHGAAESIAAIERVIGQVNEVSVAISATVEEQATVTQDISGNMSSANTAVSNISGSFETIAKSIEEIQISAKKLKKASSHIAA